MHIKHWWYCHSCVNKIYNYNNFSKFTYLGVNKIG